MKNPLIWAAFYSLLAALGQLLLKAGTNQLGAFNITGAGDVFPLLMRIVLNPFIVIGAVLFAGGFLFWLFLLSWFQLGVIFPLTAMTFIFVAWMSYFTLGETLGIINYFGMLLIALGVYFLLYR